MITNPIHQYLHGIKLVRFKYLIAGLYTAFLFSRCTPESQLIHNGHSDYKIIVAENAPEPEQRAARELEYYLEKIGGVKIPLVHETDEIGRACVGKECRSRRRRR